MRKYLKSFAIISITLTLTGSVAFAMQPQPQVEPPKTEVVNAEVTPEPKHKEEIVETPQPTPEETPTVVPAPSPEPAPTPAPAPVSDNETVIWNYLTWAGFTRNQIAGIMGNLQQEHNFRTDGDGIAQWTGNRKANLMNDPNWQDINVQLSFLVRELKGTEIAAYNAIKASTSVEEATVAFQNIFERCNPAYCMQNQRIQYAYAILARH